MAFKSIANPSILTNTPSQNNYGNTANSSTRAFPGTTRTWKAPGINYMYVELASSALHIENV